MRKQQKPLDFNTVKSQLRQGQLEKLYVLSGEEDFLAENLMQSIKVASLQPGFEAVDCVHLDGSSRVSPPSLERLRREAATPAFASPRRLVVVRNSGLFAAKSGRQAQPDTPAAAAEDTRERTQDKNRELIDFLQRLADGVCFVFWEEKIDRRQKLLMDAIYNHGILAIFERQKPPELVKWLTGLCQRQGVRIERRAAESLVDRCDASMRAIRSECDKLLLYCAGSGRQTIDLELVDALCIQDIRGGIFDLTDAIAAGNSGRAVELLQALLFRKEPTTLIRFLLARHLRNLIIAHDARSDAELASTAGIPPFVASRLRTQTRKVAIDPLEALYHQCHKNDVAAKSGRMADLLALETLVVSACSLFAG